MSYVVDLVYAKHTNIFNLISLEYLVFSCKIENGNKKFEEKMDFLLSLFHSIFFSFLSMSVTDSTDRCLLRGTQRCIQDVLDKMQPNRSID